MYDFVMDFTRFLSKEQFITILTWHSNDWFVLKRCKLSVACFNNYNQVIPFG